MAKATKTGKKPAAKKTAVKEAVVKKIAAKKTKTVKKATVRKPRKRAPLVLAPMPDFEPTTASSAVLDRLWQVVLERQDADPHVSHSARLMSRGTAKVAQKFGEEAVECVIEAVAGNRGALINESADVLYHLLVLWVNGGIRPEEVWAELERREGVSGIAEKASRVIMETRKIP
jgi:phosphoribosyl-ATP pyrophosphohydrolase